MLLDENRDCEVTHTALQKFIPLEYPAAHLQKWQHVVGAEAGTIEIVLKLASRLKTAKQP
jgi:hypothetical protein